MATSSYISQRRNSLSSVDNDTLGESLSLSPIVESQSHGIALKKDGNASSSQSAQLHIPHQQRFHAAPVSARTVGADPYQGRKLSSFDRFFDAMTRDWQPEISTFTIIIGLAVLCIVCAAIGLLLLVTSLQMVRVSSSYHHCLDAFGQWKKNSSLPPECGDESVTLTIPNDMESPVYVYMRLDNFDQNVRRYVASRSDEQLRGAVLSDTSTCSPVERPANDTKTLYPCGLIAWSFMNDGYTSDDLNLDTSAKAIAWNSDVDDKFIMRPLDPSESRIGREGMLLPELNDGHLIAWMRTAALQSFHKLHGVHRGKTLKKNQEITISIKPSPYLPSYGAGKRAIVMSTISWMGGQNYALSISYLITSLLTAIVAVIAMFLSKKHLMKNDHPSTVTRQPTMSVNLSQVNRVMNHNHPSPKHNEENNVDGHTNSMDLSFGNVVPIQSNSIVNTNASPPPHTPIDSST